ncbi:hypothetical protein SAMN05443551_0061 [Marivita hallyeonensis]|uniref:Uncharacterized protein n=2 Tax=Marivita hallyeonensis TaxID=996342 RepID=A0A1M5Y5F9_9RHOB|nr:hypothetical protein SAMN05443551_0061 [Marivita hallyeonensis]
MPEPIDPGTAQDFDQPLNTDPDYTVSHIFSTDDISATFDGGTQGDPGATYIDFSGANGTKTTKEGVTLYPIDSEFGFIVTDFSGAEQKAIDGSYTEGWAGDLTIGGEQAGLVVSDAPTDVFKTPAVLGTWLTGLGSNTVKASTEHYVTMQNVLSDQMFPEDPSAVYQLDDDLILLSQNPLWNEQYVRVLLADQTTYGVTDANEDGVVDIRDLLNPNESTIEYDIAYGNDYSVTMKDDGKLLYRWGTAVKRPNDVRIEVELPLPEEFNFTDAGSGLKQLFRITEAELATHHTITNNPNDQIRPEDYENESAIGTLPTYQIVENYNGETGRTVWESTDDYYAGDGTLYPAGTILRDSALAGTLSATILQEIGATSKDLEQGFTNAWYTTMDREPFEPVLTPGGDYETGPRWRLKPDKYGQDLPSVVIPEDPSDPLPIQNGEEKYEVGAETQTVINLLDWATPISPLAISAGWQNNSGTVSGNGLNMTDNFDVAFYVKGDIKPATLYSTELVMSYEAVEINAAGTTISGTADSDFLVGVNGNTFNGGAGEDLFVLSYGVSAEGPETVTASVVEDFEVGVDKLGLIGFDALAEFDVDELADRQKIQQGASGNDLTISVDGVLVATLEGVAADLGVSGGPTAGVDPGEGLDIGASFLITNPGESTVNPNPDPAPVTTVLNSGNSNINVDGTTNVFLDFGGQDTYTILNSLSADVTITDNDPSIINLPTGIIVSEALFLADGVEFTINDNTVTLLGDPASFEFVFGGTPIDPMAGTSQSYTETADAFGTIIPAPGEAANAATITGAIQDDGTIDGTAALASLIGISVSPIENDIPTF